MFSTIHETAMTPEQISLVRQSWRQLLPASHTLAVNLIQRLAIMDPQLRQLLPEDTQRGGQRLVQIISMAVHNLDKLRHLQPTLQSLGERYAAQGIQAHHYDTLREAFLWTLAQGLGLGFEGPVGEAWASACDHLFGELRKANQQPIAA